ncbi:DNA polymerase-3 subunit gamma/tau [Allopseudospirillum japonicum]|uniref:DNA polymerase III subunit gamma/tau n=1 Tax=Allopseudospirillum japonicum TaxID=64971 RepID=A0A1H6QCH3_9GAMM|nr:DNA polymerase III subunit gamma/tau [Allopseudospirillum japonicum]SEI41403.1 DNA polymerase-3 subunit gamma/tau [Allopseudospirillum japonicum]
MTYQVLARKWRPRTFHELIGQDAVRQALVNALDSGRLHHAYLFTGTRGVGKTSIARILAKCLNCEQGVSSVPCGLCTSCQEIDSGRFVDLIEVDAASRTKVEDTRELLDNVQYAPTRGRYKVYLIDEVHMLSTHSFNALLKTLEEPPPHVKFLLATTDPQKLPVTILSRCLQFSLRNMTPAAIVTHLSRILAQEGLAYEDAALWALAQAAQGSMRDALSLTDQAIAFTQGQLEAKQVRSLLGTLDHQHLWQLLQALVAQDAASLLAVVEEIAQYAPDYDQVLQALSALLHRIALAQAAPQSLAEDYGDAQQVREMALHLPAEDVHLFYQIAIQSRPDLALAPDPQSGLEMTLLRMLAFRPQGIPYPPEQALEAQENIANDVPVQKIEVKKNLEPPVGAAAIIPETQVVIADMPAPKKSAEAISPAGTKVTHMGEAFNQQWCQEFAQAPFDGLVRNLAAELIIHRQAEGVANLYVPAHLIQLVSEERKQVIAHWLQQKYALIECVWLTESPPQNWLTPAAYAYQQAQTLRQELLVNLQEDPQIHALQEAFSAQLDPQRLEYKPL